MTDLPTLTDAHQMLRSLIRLHQATDDIVSSPVLATYAHDAAQRKATELHDLIDRLYESIPNIGARRGWRFIWRETADGDICEQDIMISGYISALAQWSTHFDLMPDDCADFSVTRTGGR